MDEPKDGPSQRPSQIFSQADKAYMSGMTIPSRSGKQLKFDMAVTQYISEGNLAFNHVASTAFKNLIASPQRSAFETSLENHNINSHISYKLDSCALYKSYPWWYKNHYLFWLQGKQTFSGNSLKTQLSFKLLAGTIYFFHLSCKCDPNVGFTIQFCFVFVINGLCYSGLNVRSSKLGPQPNKISFGLTLFFFFSMAQNATAHMNLTINLF